MTKGRDQQGANASADRPARRYNAGARINDVIEAEPAVIDRLEALHPTFRRLRDREGRETIGEMATLGDVADIAEVPISVLLAVVNGEVSAPCAAGRRDGEQERRPAWMERFDEAVAARIDARPILADGHDPFIEIMKVVDEVPAGGGLTIDAPFNPSPLRRMLAGKGFATFGQRLAPHHWRIFCRHGEMEETGRPERPEQPMPTTPELGAKVWRAGDGVHIDVRGLERPRPMIAILSLLDGPGHEGRIIAHLDREPVFLYPELAERGWSCRIVPGEPDEVRLVLAKGGG